MRVVALGDSTSCGEGVGLGVPRDRTWPALLAGALPGAHLLLLATPGAKVRDLRSRQLPPAVERAPHLATVLVGLNDAGRGGFSADGFASDLLVVVEALRSSGADVLLGRLHDPTGLLPLLPGRLRQLVRTRIKIVNAAVDRAVQAGRDAATGAPDAPAVHLLDLGQIPALQLRRSWDVDRLHPSAAGHRAIAEAAAAVLRRAGRDVGPVRAEPAPDAARGPAAETWWALRHGLPWLIGRLQEATVPVPVGLVRRPF